MTHPLLQQRRRSSAHDYTLDFRLAYQRLDILYHGFLPDSFAQLGPDAVTDQLEGQLLAFNALVYQHDMKAVARLQGLAGQALVKSQQLALELGYGRTR